jgi:hypothetical protein
MALIGCTLITLAIFALAACAAWLVSDRCADYWGGYEDGYKLGFNDAVSCCELDGIEATKGTVAERWTEHMAD